MAKGTEVPFAVELVFHFDNKLEIVKPFQRL